jgi:hypothetical protein
MAVAMRTYPEGMVLACCAGVRMAERGITLRRK